MVHISSFALLRHLRSDPIFHIIHSRGNRIVRSGRGLSFWFLPLSTSLAKIPCDDREQSFVFKGRSLDFQEVTAQGVVTYRVTEPEKLAQRIDFSIDSRSALYSKTPLEQLSQLLTQLAQQYAAQYLAKHDVQDILNAGVGPIRSAIRESLPKDPALWDLGLDIVSVRVSQVSPTAELEKALQAATREAIQQQADKATFERRALAVERERAIQENELRNKIELARQEQELIQQRGQNALRKAQEQVATERVSLDARLQQQSLEADTKAKSLRTVEQARLELERERMNIARELPSSTMFGLAARELATNLKSIDHLSLSPDMLSGLLQQFVKNQQGPSS